MNQSYDIIIVGAGIVGLAFACLLPSSLKIAIVENQSLTARKIPQLTDPYDLRVSAINYASQKIFEKIDVWPEIKKARISPFRGMQVWDGTGNGRIEFDCFEIGEAQLGHIIENSVMQTALLQQLSHRAIDLFTSVQIEKILQDNDAVYLILQNGQRLQGKLLVGADGANSWVREQMGIELKQRPYFQQALVTNVATEYLHQLIARQKFSDNGILAFLPLIDQRQCSIVWSTSIEEADRLMSLSEKDFNRTLTENFDECLGAVKKIAPLQKFSLYMRHVKNYSQHRVVLIGDAAHTIHPLAGQGMNLGLADAACLADIIIHTMQKGRDIGYTDTLRRYERARKVDVLLMIALMEGFKRLFGSQSDSLIYLRNTGLNLTNKSALLKNFFMRQAIGN